MKVIIIGGVAGGASAAARLRRLDENAEITIYEKSGYVSYANCGLPYYIGGIIEDKEELTLQTPESFKNRFNIDVKVLHEVIRIDPLNKEVTVKNLSDNTDRWLYLESYVSFSYFSSDNTRRISLAASSGVSKSVLTGSPLSPNACNILTAFGTSSPIFLSSFRYLKIFAGDPSNTIFPLCITNIRFAYLATSSMLCEENRIVI